MTSSSTRRPAPVELLCRLSVYVTLAFSAVTLSYAQAELFSFNIVFATAAGAVLLLAFAKHGVWILSNSASNAWAMAVALATIAWIAISFATGYPEWVRTTPFPGVLLPFTGQFLTSMLLLMLFRQQRLRDIYWLHLFGAVLVALACVLAVLPLFAVFLVSYLMASVWSLILLSEHRGMLSGPASGRASATAPASGLWVAAKRAVLVAALACLLFFVTPRMTDTEWNFTLMLKGTPLVHTGFSPQIDLHHTGQRQVSGKMAFEVLAEDAAGKPKLDLHDDQRWRGLALDHYDEGSWVSKGVPRPPARSPLWLRHGTRKDLPELGAESYVLTISLNPADTRGGLFVADPVVRRPDKPVPLIGLTPGEWRPFFNVRDLSLVGRASEPPQEFRYAQATRPLAADEVVPADAVSREYFVQLINLPRPRIVTWTAQLLQQLVREKVLAPEDLQTQVDRSRCEVPMPLPQNRAKIARALESFLARSTEFSYTLDLRRQDPALDPVEDFLFNVRQGHCEHFATALVLMLRSARIPARMVNGFRGAHSRRAERGDGWYAVQESDAHAWAEALVPVPGAKSSDVYWLTLDPSPVDAAAAEQSATSWELWWEYQKSRARVYWRGVFVEGTAEPVYDEAVPLLHTWLVQPPWQALSRSSAQGSGSGAIVAVVVIALGVAAATVWGFCRSRGRRLAAQGPARSLPAVGFFARFEAVAERRSGLKRAPSQTPQEFACSLETVWRAMGLDAEISGVPPVVARAFDEVRYGGKDLEEAGRRRLEGLIARADSALAARDGNGAAAPPLSPAQSRNPGS